MSTSLYAPLNGKTIAGLLVTKAKQDGILPYAKDCVCVDCGEPACDMDHRDYNKPLVVDPVCRRCNLRRGPAIPLVGAFRTSVRMGSRPYRKRNSVVRVFRAIGAPTDFLNELPNKLTLSHWEEIVPVFEQAYAEYAQRSA